MKGKITTISSADLENKFNLILLGSLEIENPELLPYCIWKEKPRFYLCLAEKC